jgi:short-subunit dehydrogenase
MTDFTARYGPWALVTGASSGIGREFARQLAARGLNLLLVARRAERLDELAAELAGRHGIEARPLALDLCGDDFLAAIRAAVAGLEIGLLVNSAGFALTGPYLDMDPGEMTRMLALNCRAPLALAREFGPAMRARRRGGIIFLSSVAGFAGAPQWSLYSATKAFNLLLGEGLAAELRGDGVDVLVLAPGTTRTEFLDVAGIGDFMSLGVEQVVSQALGRLGRSDIVTPGLFYRAGIFVMRFLPRSVNRVVYGRILAGMRRP